MPIERLAEMTWEEVSDLDGARSVAILPLGAIEAHGPHLPLSTDVVIGEAMARSGAEKLAEAGLTPILLPALPYTTAGFAAAFPGTITVGSRVVCDLIVEIARSLGRADVGTLALANVHLDPVHLGALRGAVSEIRAAELLKIVYPDITRKPWALRLSDEFKSGACHAGCYEGSVMMAERRELVREEIQAVLPDNPASLSEAIVAGKTSFKAAGGPQAYFGYPANATAEEGAATVEILGGILSEAVLQRLRLWEPDLDSGSVPTDVGMARPGA